jgi:hypothetical protein
MTQVRVRHVGWEETATSEWSAMPTGPAYAFDDRLRVPAIS